MATTNYGVNDALAVKTWARDLAYEVKKGLEIAPLIGTTPNSIIQLKTENKSAGDKVTVGLRTRLRGAGVSEGTTLEGNEESLTTYSDSVLVNELAHAVRVAGEDTIDQQRVLFNLREEGKMALADWYAERLSLSFFIQGCGYTASSITYRGVSTSLSTLYTGLNSVSAPTNRIYATGSTDQAVGASSSSTMTLDMVVKAKEKAQTMNPKIRPVRINGADKYVMYVHPYQVTDLKLEAQASGSISWADIQLAALQGGQTSGNPIYTGAIGEYDGVILRENEDVTTGVHSSNDTEEANVRRAVLFGAQAMLFAQSSRFSKNSPYKWVEEEFDYGRQLGISAQGILGMKRAQFNSVDFGAVVVSTYAAAHT